MIYEGLEFIDLINKETVIKVTDDYVIHCLDFSDSIILNKIIYSEFIKLILDNFQDFNLINVKLKPLLRIFIKNDTADNIYLRLVKVVYKCISNPYNRMLDILQCLINEPNIYFIALNFLFYYCIKGYNVEHFYENIKYQHDIRNNYQPAILTQDKINTIINVLYRNSSLSRNAIILGDIISDYDYFQVNDNNLVSITDYLQDYYTEKELVSIIREHYNFEFIDEEDNTNLHYFFILAIRDHQFNFKKVYFLYQSYYFFIFYAQLILPQYNKKEYVRNMLSLLKVTNYTNNYCFLYSHLPLNPTIKEKDIPSGSIIDYPNVEEIDQRNILFRRIFNNSQYHGNKDILNPLKTMINNLMNFTIIKYRYHEILNCLIRTSDKTTEDGVIYRFNMSFENLARRLDLYYLKSDINPRTNNTHWLFSNSHYITNATNKNMLTPSARIARTLGAEYAEYATETMYEMWKNSNCKVFLCYSNKNIRYLYSMDDIKNNISDYVFKLDQHSEFTTKEIIDLILLLKEANYSFLTELCNMLQKVIVNKRNIIANNFTNIYHNLQIDQQILIKKYFYCYFMLINYSRFWLGPGHTMDHSSIKQRNPILIYREQNIQRIIILLQSYRQEITLFMEENWDSNLYLFSDYNIILTPFNESVTRMGITNTYNTSKLYDRIQLLSQGLFCMAIFCEQSKYIINTIVFYLGDININNSYLETKKFMQNLSDKILPLIVNDLLASNLYQKQLTNPTYEYDIYIRMIAYYYLLKEKEIPTFYAEFLKPYLQTPLINEQRQSLAIPIFLFPADYCKLKLDNITDVPIDRVKKCLKFLKLDVRDNSNYELFNKAYEYYTVIYEYQILTEYISNNCKQNIGNLQQYSDIYHTTSIEDANNISQYVNYY